MNERRERDQWGRIREGIGRLHRFEVHGRGGDDRPRGRGRDHFREHGGPGSRDWFGHGRPPFDPGGIFDLHGRGRRGRARRGNIRAAVLALLAERPMHGYEMIQELEERTGGLWRPSPGSIYPSLNMLEDEELIRGAESGGKKLFELTDAGREELKRNPPDQAPWDEVTEGVSPSRLKLRDAISQVTVAAHQVAQVGTEEQIALARRLLVETRRDLYAMLAEDPDAPTATETVADEV